jgi:hypothetical protein
VDECKPLATGALFGLQLGDAHSRLGAEDGLAFGSVHGAGALELVYWIRASGYSGHVYFDTFPVWWCRLPIAKPEFKARLVSALETKTL